MKKKECHSPPSESRKEERISLEQRVEEQRDDVRYLVSELARSEERERERIAEILHDVLQQQIYSALLILHTLRVSDHASERQLQQVKRVLEDSLATTRKLTQDLCPPVLLEEGLAAGLTWLSLHMEEYYDLRVEVIVTEPSVRPAVDTSHLLFQAARELLFNVVKHAEIGSAQVRLWQERSTLKLEVSDEGRGCLIEDATGSASSGFGLANIRRRLKFMSGEMEIETAPDRGMRICLDLPVDV